ncbi:MAG: undecaprenyl-diphosphate phosphatase [Candidatus Fermentibacteraceae bacterium]
MNLFESMALAAIQGLTEFLPVSSSGHLALASAFMNVPAGSMAFEVVLHLGTLVAVLLVYGKDLSSIAAGVVRGCRESRLMALSLIVASVPAGIAGIFLSDSIEAVFGMPLVVSVLMLLTGTVLFLTRFSPRGRGEPGIRRGVFIGFFQALAVLPGVSRSGLTISAGLFRGVGRAEAARFSFLLSVPAILGAAVLELPEAEWNTSFGVLAVGFAVSALVGYAALKVLLRFVSAGALHRFCWYCWAIGGFGTVWFLLNRGA